MKRRYTTAGIITRWSHADALDSLARTVHEPDPQTFDTGLLDASGNRLFAIDEMERIGFVRFKAQY